MNKKFLGFALIASLIAALFLVWVFRERIIHPPARDPQFVLLNQVLDSFKNDEVEFKLDGREFKGLAAWVQARAYLLRHYKRGITAEEWIKEYCYRSKSGELIYLKFPDGRNVLMRDAFLEKLKTLEPEKANSPEAKQA